MVTAHGGGIGKISSLCLECSPGQRFYYKQTIERRRHLASRRLRAASLVPLRLSLSGSVSVLTKSLSRASS